MTIAAEAIKLSTTRSPWWSAAIAAALSLGIAGLLAGAADVSLTPEAATSGVATLGVPVLMILASLTVTGEYRWGVIRSTFIATPNRTRVLCAKAVVAAVFSGVFAVVMVIASLLLSQAIASDEYGEYLSLSEAATWRPVFAVTTFAILAAVLAVGLGTLLRHSAAVITVLLLLPYVIEPLLSAIPKIGKHVISLLPFMNAYEFVAPNPESRLWWGPWAALLYFVGVVVVVFVGAVYVINRRDP